MTEPLVVLVLLGSADPTTDGMLASMRSALGADTVVLVDTSKVAGDREALAMGENAHARAVVRVLWADGGFEHARIHVHFAPVEEWADDDLDFAGSDDPVEKGRTVGFALATMVQRLDRTSPPPPPAAPPPPPARPAIAELFVLGTGRLGGAERSAGGALGGRWTSRFGLGARAAIGFEAGTVDGAGAHSSTLRLAAGPTFGVPIGERVELGARIDGLVTHVALTRDATTRERWLGGLALVAEGGFVVGGPVMLAIGVGPELAFGTTSVHVGGTEVAVIPRVRACGELGIRFRF